MLEDRLLVYRCKRGRQDALCRIYQKYKDYLLTLAKALLYDKTAAEDVVHDVFVSFAESIGDFKLTGSLKGYLATCVGNLARDKLRSMKRQADRLANVDTTASGSNSPEQSAIQAEQLTQLREAMAQLSYQQREAVVLHVKGQLKLREIARLQDVAVSTIHARYHQGLDKLRSLLNSEVEK